MKLSSEMLKAFFSRSRTRFKGLLHYFTQHYIDALKQGNRNERYKYQKVRKKTIENFLFDSE